MAPFPYPWLFAVLGGAIILGFVIAYGAYKSSRAKSRQKRAAQRATHDLYHKDHSRN